MAKSKARNYTQLTLKKLYALSGNQCAFPDCPVMFVNWENDTNFSNICHIEDAKENLHKSDRYNSNMTDVQRADYTNLVLFCPNHHIETNDITKYSVENLKEIKRNHETIIRQLISQTNILAQNPSALNTIIGYIGKNIFENTTSLEPTNAPDTTEKILYNNVMRYKPIIEEYAVYQGFLNASYKQIEEQGSTRKEIVLQNIKNLYLKEKGKYESIEDIRLNADNIIEKIEAELWNKIENSNNIIELPIEAIEISLLVILVDAFMRCNILEEPPKV
jgi:hypothetical protein